MKKYLINNNSDSLLIFFTGWGCDEYEFEHLESDCDVLLFYDLCFSTISISPISGLTRNTTLFPSMAGAGAGSVIRR